MKAVFIGSDSKVEEMAALAVRLRWPDGVSLMASTAGEGLVMVEQEWPDVVLLHPDFTDMTLSQAIQDLRRFSNVPLVVLGDQGDEMEVITSLELGADDYVRLPCDLTELTTRIWTLLRRAGVSTPQEGGSPLVSGRLLVNPATYEVFLDKDRVALTSTEFRLLYLLLKNWGIVVSHKALERSLWGEEGDANGIGKKYVQRLRRKLGDNAREPSWIANVHGVGYRFIGPAPSPQETSRPVLAS